MENRRRYPRLETALQVRYHPPMKDSQFSYTITKDVSRGGLCMPALSAIAKTGDIINMDIDIDKGDGVDNISATGRVKWARALKRKAILDQEIGIEFVDMAPADIDKLVDKR
jgi:c-di-GMP-binding flagellar brake protein YcgR